mgnify:CR=1 FL=1
MTDEEKIAALYLRFEKDRVFNGVAQTVNAQLPGLTIDEVLLVAERLAEVLAAREEVPE